MQMLRLRRLRHGGMTVFRKNCWIVLVATISDDTQVWLSVGILVRPVFPHSYLLNRRMNTILLLHMPFALERSLLLYWINVCTWHSLNLLWRICTYRLVFAYSLTPARPSTQWTS